MKDFKYILTSNNTLIPETIVLINNPEGWDTKSITFKRSNDYHSVLRNFSLDLKFVKDGKKFLDNSFDSYGIESQVSVQIYQRNPFTLVFDRLFYSGVLDFSTYSKDVKYTTVQIIDSDKLSKFATRDDKDLDLYKTKSVDDVNITPFAATPKTATFTYLNAYLWAYYRLGIWSDTNNRLSNEGNFYYVTFNSYPTGILSDNVLGSSVDASPANGVIYTNSSGGNRNVKINNLKFNTNLTGLLEADGLGPFPSVINYQLFVNSYYADNSLRGSYLIDSFTDTVSNANKVISYQSTKDTNLQFINLYDGDYIKFFTVITMDNPLTGYAGTYSLTLNFTEDFVLSEQIPVFHTNSDSDVFLIHDAFTRLIQLMTSETDSQKLLYSPVLGNLSTELVKYGNFGLPYNSIGAWSNLSVFSGEMVRNFDIKRLYCSFKKLFKSVNSFANLGFWYDRNNDRFEIQQKEKYFRDERILTLGEVKDLKTTVSEDYIHNNILCGCANDGKYEEINGIIEFNNRTEYSNSNTRIKNDLEIRSEYRSDCLGIEFTRRKQYATSESEDTEEDNNVFFAVLKKVGSVYSVKTGEDINLVGGLPNAEEFYNWELMPKYQILNNGALIRSAMWKNQGSKIKYIYSSSSRNVFSQIESTDAIVYKQDDVVVSTLATPYFFPMLYEFSAPVTWEIIEQLNSDPHGYIEFSYLNETFYGYVLEVSTEPYKRNGNWLLLQANINR